MTDVVAKAYQHHPAVDLPLRGVPVASVGIKESSDGRDHFIVAEHRLSEGLVVADQARLIAIILVVEKGVLVGQSLMEDVLGEALYLNAIFPGVGDCLEQGQCRAW
ncbi:hypothetical protein [Xylella fastidiosa]|uniref:Uncharacterized protein n=1 Tax=Xylella fastidiosa subsp. fastidiosa TaxID=644356 RepID=A0AAJ5R1S2_XYLFS|nr:hypothetical protein [Xylella fastidiosa]WCF27544.1 hypothetical protein OK117_07760 [Xylella fastidiosa subsp. fastidiosa]